ncbi:MAG: ABC transporter permease subunit [Chloroflexi bacterium]|nr:ABC transporter permease subunit [Chloroflexota bacterium]
MGRFLAGRFIGALGVVVASSLVIFMVVRLIPGDPISVLLEQETDPTVKEAFRRLYGLDQPVYVQYFVWARALVTGDFGLSLITHTPVIEQVIVRAPRTLYLMVGSLALSLAMSIPAALIAARKNRAWPDSVVLWATTLVMSIPSFWIGIIFTLVFAIILHWLPGAGFVDPSEDLAASLRSMILPWVTLGLSMAAFTVRVLRASLLDVLTQDYVRTARAKGVHERRVLLKHALKNAAIPAVTLIGVQIGTLMGGTIVIEKVFGYPGMGQLIVNSIARRMSAEASTVRVANTTVTSVRHLFRDRRVAFASGMLLVAAIVAVAGPLMLAYPYDLMGAGPPVEPMSPAHLMGTDQFGRDQFSRVVWGTRISLGVPLAVLAGAVGLGLPLGLLIGYARGLIDNVLSRALDVLFAFPVLLLVLVLATLLGPGLTTATLALVIVYIPVVARLVRGAVIVESEREYIVSARVAGATPARIVVRQILPSITSPVLVLATSIMAFSILAEAAISFLGVGAQPPASSWGKMLTDSSPYYSTAPYLAVFPGLAIVYLVLALNLLGDGLRDQLDPHSLSSMH